MGESRHDRCGERDGDRDEGLSTGEKPEQDILIQKKISNGELAGLSLARKRARIFVQAKESLRLKHGDENEHIDRSYYPRHHRIHYRPAGNRLPRDRAPRWSHRQARISSYGGLAGRSLPSHPLASVSKKEGAFAPLRPPQNPNAFTLSWNQTPV